MSAPTPVPEEKCEECGRWRADCQVVTLRMSNDVYGGPFLSDIRGAALVCARCYRRPGQRIHARLRTTAVQDGRIRG